MEKHPYKVLYGGRNSLKSWSDARALLLHGALGSERILCARETQSSIRQSVHQLLVDQIQEMGLQDYYDVQQRIIRGKQTNTSIVFTGLSDQTIDSLKSFEGSTKCWAEEASAITKRSWQILLPTIFRGPNDPEMWVSFNPDLDTDETYQRFVVNPPPGAVVVEMNYRDAIEAGWWNDEQEKLRQYDLINSPDEYANIWEGKPRSSIAGAIYAREVADMISEERYRPIPYDPRLPVHRVWDIGWGDYMAVLMVQMPSGSAINIINYFEDKNIGYPDITYAMSELRYRWGDDWMPHDSKQHHPTSSTSGAKQMRDLGFRVRNIERTSADVRIRAARPMFPRVYLDNSMRKSPPDRPHRSVGGKFLMERLRKYRTKTTYAGQSVIDHNDDSHGADAFGGLAEIVSQIRNEIDTPRVFVPGYVNVDASMGLLG